MADAQLVRMSRFPIDAGDGPTEADVHPDEVDNYARGGWFIAPETSAAAAAKPRRPRKFTTPSPESIEPQE